MSITELAGKLKHIFFNWNNEWNQTWWDRSWTHENNWLPWHENMSHHINQIFFVLWTTIKQTFLCSEIPPYGIMKWPLIKSPDKYSHASRFIKHFPFLNLEWDTLIQLQKWWDTIIITFFQYLSTNNIWICPSVLILQ